MCATRSVSPPPPCTPCLVSQRPLTQTHKPLLIALMSRSPAVHKTQSRLPEDERNRKGKRGQHVSEWSQNQAQPCFCHATFPLPHAPAPFPKSSVSASRCDKRKKRTEFDRAVHAHEDVVALDVAVDHRARVQILEGFQALRDKRNKSSV